VAGCSSLARLIFFCFFLVSSFAITEPDTDFLLGQQFFLREQYEQALVHFQNSLRRNRSNVETNYSVGKIHVMAGEPKKAFQYLRDTLALDPEYKDAQALFQQVLAEARKLYGSSPTDDPQIMSIRIYMDLGRSMLVEAMSKLEYALRLYPDEAVFWDHLANFYYRQNKLDEALEHLRKAISLDPSSPTIFKHYESTYFLKHHKLAPRQRETGDPETKQVATRLLEQELREEILRERLADGDSDFLAFSEAGSFDVAESGTEKVQDDAFFRNLLKQQAAKIPPPKPVSQATTENSTPVPVYAALPETTVSGDKERAGLLERARTAYAEKNWELAATTYGILSHNEPSNKELKNQFENAKKFDQFERAYRNALRLLALGVRNPENFSQARTEFENLDKDIYLQLYKKSSFNDYLARIAYATGRIKDAEALFRQWIKDEPRDENILESYHFLLLCQNQLSMYDEAFQTVQEAMAVDSSGFLRRPGVSTIRIQLYIRKYWWLALIFVGVWLLLFMGYTSLKLYFAKKSSDRKEKFRKARDMLADKRYKEAIKRVDELLLQDLSPAEIYNLQFIKASALHQSGQLEQAELLIKAILARQKDDPQSLALLGKIYSEYGRIEDDCLEPYRILITKEPNNIELHKLYLKALKKANIFDDVTEKTARKILEVESYNGEITRDLTDIYIRRGIKTEAVADTCQKYLEMHPANTVVLLHYLETLIELGNYIEAIRIAKQLIDVNPDLERAHQLTVKAFDQLAMHDELKSFYYQLTMDYPQSIIMQKMYTLIENTYKGGGTVFHDIEDERSLTEASFSQGLNFMDKAQYEEAILKLQFARNDERFKFDATLLLAKAFLEKEEMKSAIFYFEQLNLNERKLDEKALEICYSFAEYFQEQDNRKKALSVFQIIAKNNVSYRDVFQRIELLNM
jgi:tetratricopeptide (TPR) repeat protein